MTDSAIRHTAFGDGTPLVLIHGYTVDHRVLFPLEPVFADRPGWQRLYLDLPGHGASPRLPGPTSAEALAEAVFAWIDAELGTRPFAVVGQSFGGQLARAVTARYGEQVLGSALLAPVVAWYDDRTLPAQTVVERDQELLDRLPAAERELFEYITARLDKRSWELVEQYVLPGWRVHDRAAAAELEAAFMLPHWPERQAPEHRGRHLLVTTRQDALVGWRDQLALLDHYPRLAATVLDGVGHNPQVESAEAVRGLFGAWLDELARP
ncbi:alpha/beta fold hydrolase [Kitasatospora sp. SUK 42]|uniref:alpha/beta fold hydrolase n=1 Tax=Kitasatospora sp. SUK 42 TaxID=1588882 RepID=UPI0018CAE95F|nr:alpha/beta hydrolase [Kitasatospora sp. SUK 42]MBV2153893.1 alpha/beta fold hydrolase [Kitasatospora sp. SUK 42]